MTQCIRLACAQEGASEELQDMRAVRQRAAAVLRPGAGPPATDAEEEAAEVLAQLKVLQARGQGPHLKP